MKNIIIAFLLLTSMAFGAEYQMLWDLHFSPFAGGKIYYMQPV